MDFENNSTPSAEEILTSENTILKEINKYSQKTKNFTVEEKTEASSDFNTSYPRIIPDEGNVAQEENRKNILARGRYEVLDVLGKGGMGIVQSVYDHLIGREVALKRIKLDKNNVEQLSEKQKVYLWRLFIEASITANLEHPNIIPLYDIQEEENEEFFFTMRKVEGETLRNIFQKQKNGVLDYTEKELISIFLTVCDAISYAHSRGVIHRDLKPENIMVGKFGEVYVMDWGIAKKIKESNREKTRLETLVERKLTAVLEIKNQYNYRTAGAIGTVGYMAPEQLENSSQSTPQSDIYSLGKILRECFTYISPLEELKKEIECNSEKQKKKIFYLMEKKIPTEIQGIILKATSIKKNSRYYVVERLAKEVTDYYKNQDQKFIQLSSQKVVQSQNHWKWFFSGMLLSLIIIVIFIILAHFFLL